jgi:hypothetical protein
VRLCLEGADGIAMEACEGIEGIFPFHQL